MASKSQCPVILSFLLPWTSSEAIDRGQEYEYGYQLYDEGGERIKVEANYFRGKIDLTDESTFRFQLLNDSISGSSPTGVLPDGDQPFISDLEDVRTGILAALQYDLEDQRVELGFPRVKNQIIFRMAFHLITRRIITSEIQL